MRHLRGGKWNAKMIEVHCNRFPDCTLLNQSLALVIQAIAVIAGVRPGICNGAAMAGSDGATPWSSKVNIKRGMNTFHRILQIVVHLSSTTIDCIDSAQGLLMHCQQPGGVSSPQRTPWQTPVSADGHGCMGIRPHRS